MPRPVTHDDSLRARLLEVAAEALARNGAGLSVRAVASAAGTSTSAIYSLFGDRAALLEAVATEAESSFRASQVAVPVTDDPVTDLRALGRAYRAWALAHPALYAVMFDGRVPDPAGPPRKSALDREQAPSVVPLLDAVERALAAGALTGDAATIVLGIWSMVHGRAALEIGACDTGIGEALAATHDAYLDAVLRAWAS